MNGFDEDGADAHCVHCGGKIYFEVGPGICECQSCGKNWQKTDQELEQEKEEMSRPVDWDDLIHREIEHCIDSLEMYSHGMPPAFRAKADRLLAKLRETERNL